MDTSYLTLIFPLITVICLLLFYWYYRRISLPQLGTTEWIERIINKPQFNMTYRRHRLERRDTLPILIITIVYAAIAFLGLGDMTNPQSFYRFTKDNNTAIITFDEPVEIGSIMYYTGLWIGHYTLEFSADGANWQAQYPAKDKEFAMNQPHSDLFKWLRATINEDNVETKYIRITASKTPLELGEIAIYTKSGALITPDMITSLNTPELFDEQNVIPSAPSYMNSMYFDEIYHGRTAYENLNNVTPYETTHPPLGKLIISIGISIFGMVPFGWRFMGTLFGVFMLPILYIFLKNMFGKSIIAICGTILFAFDFMHFAQTRIATIDTYAVIFIMLSYFFMYRYITQDLEAPLTKTLPSLALSGLFFGIGCACKWVVIYSGSGLLALYIIYLILRARYYKKNELTGFTAFLIQTLWFSFLFYLVVPAIIYCLSYFPNGLAAGMKPEDGMFWDPKYYQLIWDNQKFMFSYHSKLVATHSYSSSWYQWIVDGRPILYYRDTSMGAGLKSSFASFGNPIVWWGGLLAIIAMVYRVIKHKDGKALFILIGYLSQLVPWLFVSRVVFIYHYFPSVLFLVLALTHVLNSIWEREQGQYKRAVFGFTGAAVLLFIAFYPVISGVTVPEVYTKYFLRWIPFAWPF